MTQSGAWRLALILLVVAGLSPGLVWRSAPQVPRETKLLLASPLAIAPVDLGGTGSPKLERAWRLTGDGNDFGGYSSLDFVGPDRLIVISDFGKRMDLALTPEGPELLNMASVPNKGRDLKSHQDTESVTHDPASGRLWLGYEMSNIIARFDRDMSHRKDVAPVQMKDWPKNSGLEAFQRLSDGRFLAIAEGSPSRWSSTMPALLFSGDPVEKPDVTEFRFRPPYGYRATDLALLPDGRVLVLMRSFALRIPPKFTARIGLIDPVDIRAGEELPWKEIARLEDGTLPLDNYEGLAVVPKGGDEVALWLISDDNTMRLQRTYLLELSWKVPPRKAGG